MLRVCTTGSAGRYFGSPACDAASVQAPAPSRVTVPAATEHAPLAANVTGSSEDAVAVTTKGGWPYGRLARSGNEMVWGIRRGVARTTWLVDATALPTWRTNAIWRASLIE